MNDLWKELTFEDEDFLTPKEYLEKQSELLLNKTNKLLFLEIKQYEAPTYSCPEFEFEFDVYERKLISGEVISYWRENLYFKVSLKSKAVDYEYGILTFNHDVLGYPVEVDLNPDIVINMENGIELKVINNLSDFEVVMSEVFSSIKIKNVIKAMYSMSKK